MTDSIKPSAASGSDDPWEQLAEDLFGLEFGKEHAPLEVSAPAEAPPLAAEPVVVDRPTESAARPEASEIPVVAAENREPAPQYAEIPVPPATHSAQDSYWDALANWNWGEGERPAARSTAPESRRGEPPRGGGRASRDGGSRDGGSRDEGRSAPSTSRPGPAPVEPRSESRRSAPDDATDTGDFGLGVLSEGAERGPSRPGDSKPERIPSHVGPVESDDFDDDDEGDESTAGESGESETPAAGDENGPRKRRRRRRRRRSRNGNEAAGTTAQPAGEAPAKVPGEDWDQPAEPTAAPRGEGQRDDRPRRPAGEGRPQTERPQAERGDDRSRGSRRRRGDRRGAPAPAAEERNARPDDEFEQDSPMDEVTTVGGGEVGTEFATDDANGDSGDAFVNFDEVPTWEEAISYLLHPNQVQVDSNGGSGASANDARQGDQPRQTRHYGGRRS